MDMFKNQLTAILQSYGDAIVDSIMVDHPELQARAMEWKAKYVNISSKETSMAPSATKPPKRQRKPKPEAETCTGVKPNGERCSNRAKCDGLCGVHLRKRDKGPKTPQLQLTIEAKRVQAYEEYTEGPASPHTIQAIYKNKLAPMDSDDEGPDGYTDWSWMKE